MLEREPHAPPDSLALPAILVEPDEPDVVGIQQRQLAEHTCRVVSRSVVHEDEVEAAVGREPEERLGIEARRLVVAGNDDRRPGEPGHVAFVHARRRPRTQ